VRKTGSDAHRVSDLPAEANEKRFATEVPPAEPGVTWCDAGLACSRGVCVLASSVGLP